MNALKAKTKINCNTCGCTLNRTKTIKVSSATKEDAKIDANKKLTEWLQSLEGKNCKVCESIIKELAA
jgi:hypothetical protein